MLKSELMQRLINRLTEKYPQITEKAVIESSQEMLDFIIESLLHHDRLEIRGFGSLTVQHQPAQIARNPQNGKKVVVSDRARVRFKQAKKLRLRLNASYR